MDMASSSTATQNQTQPEFAFDGLAPDSAPKSGEPWDIFINHRGCDVKHTLATTIYAQLHSQGFHVFLDKEALDAGDSIPAQIQHAITTATLHIAIFSPNYAQSAWCLAELTFMLKTGVEIIPIFYNVDPSDLRYIEQEKSKYFHAFSEHKRKGRYTEEKLNVWKTALYESSFKSGYLVSNNEDEATVLKNVVKRSLQIMKKDPLWVAEHPLVLDELVQGFESVATEEGVKIRGIVGMGGSGKTTLAKELYNRNFPSFERCSFVFDVRDAASRNALCEKQKKLLADLGLHHSPFDHVDEGKVVLANRLSAHRALIVLDDVDHIDQLNALLPRKDNLGSQSMVIVTTREWGVLQSWGLDCIYHMPALANPHAKQLFCCHAFLQPSPPAVFETLVEEFVRACNGLPLSLKVLGAHLNGRKSKDYWKSQLHKIKRILPREIKQILEISYDALDEEDQKMFLDVACFFLGEEKNTAIAAWDGSGWSGLQGFETLVNKCLVDLVKDTRFKTRPLHYEDIIVIRMHDHLRDMGREIASRQSPYRLWCPQQIHDDMKNHSTIRKQIRGIKPADAFVAFKEYTHQLMGNSSRRSKRPRFSSKLQILSVKGNEFTEEFASLTEDLVWLRWEGFPLQSLPSWLILKNLRVLELRFAGALKELWQDNADPPLQLIELILEGCKNLQRLPSSIRLLQHLKRLVIAEFGCSSLSEEFCGLHSLECLELSSLVLSLLPACFGNLINLRNIKLKSCRQLGSLPDSFSQLIHLEILDLEGCTMLSSLPTDLGNLTSLRKINLKECKQLSMLPDSFSQLIHLEDLNLAECDKLASLPAGFGNLTSLTKLSLSYCTQLSSLPDSFSQLIHLENLYLEFDKLASLPAGFGNLTSLTKLNLIYCTQLSSLPDSFSQLIHLEDLYLECCAMLSSLPTDLGNLTSLRKINLQECMQLSMLPDSFSQLIHLEDLNLAQCDKLASLPAGFGNLTSLTKLNLHYCTQLSSLPDSFSQLIHLEDLDLERCYKLASLPAGFGNLTSLTKLNLSYCTQLSSLPDSFSQLIHLEILGLKGCLPTDLGNFSSLREINLECCEQLSMLPDSFSQLIHLERLQLIDCKMLLSLPVALCNLIHLETFRLSGSLHLVEIVTLPVSLKTLHIARCKLLKNIRCIGGLIKLEKLFIFNCPQIEELPSLADLASLKSFQMLHCPKVEKIQGLEHAKSLKGLKVESKWRVAGIQSLENVERLEWLDLACYNISAVKACIQSIKGKECPRYMRIQGSVIRLVEAIVNPLDFPDLAVTEMEKQGTRRAFYTWNEKDRIPYVGDLDAFFSYTEVEDEAHEERKVVIIFSSEREDPFRREYVAKTEKAVCGKRGRVWEAFYQLLELLE